MSSSALPNDIQLTVAKALAEDIGEGDITAALIAQDKIINAKVVARESGIFCGTPWVQAIFKQLDPEVKLTWQIAEGEQFSAQQVLLDLNGSARAILSGERCALNFMQTLSATATQTHQFTALISHTRTKILDTRKTIPGLRTAQKYAVAIGGGKNHRMGLFDAYLIKENHIAACGGIELAIGKARELNPNKVVEIEVQNLEELSQALDAGADIIMLDNFELPATTEAVTINGGRAKLEASGGIDLKQLVAIAESGVDYISVGALTKNCQAIDLSMITC